MVTITLNDYIAANFDKDLGYLKIVIEGIHKEYLILEDGTYLKVPKDIIKNKKSWILEDIRNNNSSTRFIEFAPHNDKVIIT